MLFEFSVEALDSDCNCFAGTRWTNKAQRLFRRAGFVLVIVNLIAFNCFTVKIWWTRYFWYQDWNGRWTAEAEGNFPQKRSNEPPLWFPTQVWQLYSPPKKTLNCLPPCLEPPTDKKQILVNEQHQGRFQLHNLHVARANIALWQSEVLQMWGVMHKCPGWVAGTTKNRGSN